MPHQRLSRFLLLPELKLTQIERVSQKTFHYHVIKSSDFEVCPRCATISRRVHDKVRVCISHAPIRGKRMRLMITKRRFRCPKCKGVFTEPVQGIKKGFRTSEKFRRSIFLACKRFTDLSLVQSDFNCSSGLVYKICYEQLELELRKKRCPWPKTVGIDEHSFCRSKKHIGREFATIFVDFNNRRPKEVLLGKNQAEFPPQLEHIQGRENVSHVVMDLSRPYHSFVRDYFPNARIVADRFHVTRLFNVIVNKYRLQAFGDRRTLKIRTLLLKNSHKIDRHLRFEIQERLKEYPELYESYQFKEWMMRFYRIKGTMHATRVFNKMLDMMAYSKLPEIQTLRRTLRQWREEILRYFETRLTNGRTEGFNRKAKLIQRLAYGFRSFAHYRLKLLCTCH